MGWFEWLMGYGGLYIYDWGIGSTEKKNYVYKYISSWFFFFFLWFTFTNYNELISAGTSEITKITKQISRIH
jgi:hypothetical protein